MSGPVADRERVAEVLHDRENVHTWRGGRCDDACGISYFAKVDALLAAGVFRDEATVKAEALDEAAEAIIIPGASSLAAAWLQGRATRLRGAGEPS